MTYIPDIRDDTTAAALSTGDLEMEIEEMQRAILLHAKREALRKTLRDLGLDEPGPPVTMERVAKRVAQAYGITVDDLRNRGPGCRCRALARPRQHLMWLLERQDHPNGNPRWSLMQIAMYLNLKDHTTVVHGCAAHEKRRKDEGHVLPDERGEPVRTRKNHRLSFSRWDARPWVKRDAA